MGVTEYVFLRSGASLILWGYRHDKGEGTINLACVAIAVLPVTCGHMC